MADGFESAQSTLYRTTYIAQTGAEVHGKQRWGEIFAAIIEAEMDGM